MSLLPAMPVWVADFFSKTDHLSNEEQWAYLKLMLKTWVRNCRPIPDNDADIARLLNIGLKRWRRIRPRIESFFDLSAGTWVQPNLENVFREASERKAKIVSGAHLGGIAKSRKTNELWSAPGIAGPMPIKTIISKEDSPSGESPPLISPPIKPERKNGGQERGTRLAADWQPSSEDCAFAAVECGLDSRRVGDSFRDYWIARPGAGGIKLDWSATFRNWCRKERDNRSVSGGRSGANGSRPGGIAAALRDVLGHPAGH
jgi:uncharacterized protein YdaU (DUF1376 family)